MKNFLEKIKYGMHRYMSGRYGMDKLNKDLVLAYLLFFALYSTSPYLFGKQINLFYFLSIFAFTFYIFRMFSKNIYKRQRENQVYLLKKHKFFHPFEKINLRKKDKEHKYFKCPCCKQTLRVPVGRGKISITCPKCATIIVKRT